MDFTFDIKGSAELEKALLALPTEIAAKELTDAMTAGAEIIANAMEEGAPRGRDIGPRRKNDQHLADSIAVQVERKPIGAAVEVYVGPNAKVAWRAWFNEFGTTIHRILAKRKKVLANQVSGEIFGTKVEHPGEQPQPFMRTALSESGEEAISTIREELTKGVQRAAAAVKSKV